MKIYHVSGRPNENDKKTYLIVTDDVTRARELAGIFARWCKQVEVAVDGKTYTYPNLENLR